jgi:hypothetical protein
VSREAIVPSASSPFHPGEIAVQRRAGVAEDAARVGGIVAETVSPAAAAFLQAQRLAVVASVDPEGRVWASLLEGPPGFVRAVDETLVHLAAEPADGDPLSANLAARPELGVLIIDLGRRRRLRLNGRGVSGPEGGVFLLVDQVYGNCPKYITVRRPAKTLPAAPREGARGFTELSREQRDWIARADTLFVASAHPEGGADASHRGGPPGFVRVRDARRIAFPDYAGNNMFNTLGNLTENPRAGLLFVDFEGGRLLQLTGRAEVEWSGAGERAVRFELDRGNELARAAGTAWRRADPD